MAMLNYHRLILGKEKLTVLFMAIMTVSYFFH